MSQGSCRLVSVSLFRVSFRIVYVAHLSLIDLAAKMRCRCGPRITTLSGRVSMISFDQSSVGGLDAIRFCKCPYLKSERISVNHSVYDLLANGFCGLLRGKYFKSSRRIVIWWSQVLKNKAWSAALSANRMMLSQNSFVLELWSSKGWDWQTPLKLFSFYLYVGLMIMSSASNGYTSDFFFLNRILNSSLPYSTFHW